MTIIGFTGSRKIPRDKDVLVERVLFTLNGDRVVTGACIGIDEFVSRWFVENRPHIPQTVLVPGDRSRVSVDYINFVKDIPNVEMVFLPRSGTYRDRNWMIVDQSNVLVGFPLHRESHPESVRSGTWQTIRRAKLKNRRVIVRVLDEG